MAASASLEGPLAKLARADRQLGELKGEVEAIWPPGKAWPVRTEEHRGGLEYRFYLGALPGVDPDWALWAGEIMFDLRSALDHLSYELHLRRYRGKFPPKLNLEQSIMFPIFDTPKKWKDRGYKRVMHLGGRERRAIRHLQPDIARHDRWQMTRYALNRLNTLHNVDKHRQLHLVTGAQNYTIQTGQIPADSGWQSHPTWGAVESHGHVETWTFTKRHPTSQTTAVRSSK